MDTVNQARSILSDAESKLRDLIEQGLREQRYSDVAEIAKMADGLSKLAYHGSTTSARQPSNSNVIGQHSAAKSKPTPNSKSRGSTSKPRNKVSGKGQKQHPRFERNGNRLVKVGWSKKARKEYEHRAPREAVFAFTRHLTSQVNQGDIFAIEDLMPVHDSSGEELPAYQVYLTVAWLRNAGAIEKMGRDGYVLKKPHLQDGYIDELWRMMPIQTP